MVKLVARDRVCQCRDATSTQHVVLKTEVDVFGEGVQLAAFLRQN
jgi:hypothetical protein